MTEQEIFEKLKEALDYKYMVDSYDWSDEQKEVDNLEDYLKSSNLYLGCSDHRRKTLIEVDLYQLQEAFEDGFLAAVELYKQNRQID